MTKSKYQNMTRKIKHIKYKKVANNYDKEC